jgi:hypothetical protein
MPVPARLGSARSRAGSGGMSCKTRKESEKRNKIISKDEKEREKNNNGKEK